MTHLIKLELKKLGIAQNIIFMFAAILFSILFITISLWDSMTDPKQVKDTFESTYLVIGLLMSFIFLVYSSVLTAKLVIGEYNHRTITIMFSYPLNRIKLIASKLTINMVYTAISMTIGYICCSSYIIFADKSFNMLEGTFQPSMLRTWIPMAITTVIICMVLSLWSFIIGMIRKSVPATIVTSLIVIVLRQVIITKNTTNQESIFKGNCRFLWVVSHLYSSKDNISSIIRFKSTDCWMESQDLHRKSSTSRCQYDPEQSAKCFTAPGSVMGLRSALAPRHRRELHPHLRTQLPPVFSLTAYSVFA